MTTKTYRNPGTPGGGCSRRCDTLQGLSWLQYEEWTKKKEKKSDACKNDRKKKHKTLKAENIY